MREAPDLQLKVLHTCIHSCAHILMCIHLHIAHTHTEHTADLVKVEEWLAGGEWVGE